MLWHDVGPAKDGVLLHTDDSNAWHHVDESVSFFQSRNMKVAGLTHLATQVTVPG